MTTSPSSESPWELVLTGRPRDIGAFAVRRVLPSPMRRLVGPFLFWDHMGPADIPPGKGMDVRPHPHIHLATITYLFEGEIVHRDSLGYVQPIRPGEVNWMTAGTGIVHSERSSPEVRRTGGRIHGIQSWVALPDGHEDVPPSFHHAPASDIPVVSREGAELRVIVGEAYGVASKVPVLMPTLYVDAQLEAGAVLSVPLDVPERAVYVVQGSVDIAGTVFEPGAMVVLRPGAEVTLRAAQKSRLMLLGGAPIGSKRHIEWNFVSSSEERIAKAKEDWKARRFPTIPGDDEEFIPLPDA